MSYIILSLLNCITSILVVKQTFYGSLSVESIVTKTTNHKEEYQSLSYRNTILNQLFYSPVPLDYEYTEARIVERLYYGFGEEKDNYIIHEPRTFSGFGNQVRSLIGSIVTSLVTGRRLRIFNNSYFQVTDNAFRKLVIHSISEVVTGDDCARLVLVGGGANQATFDKLQKHIMQTGFTNAYPQSCVVIHSHSDTIFLAETIPTYNQTLQEFHLLNYTSDPRYLLYRLVLQPSQELISAILSTLEQNNLQNCVAVQLRTGSSLASFKENHSFLSLKMVEKHLKKLNQILTRKEPIFLSTDSSKVSSSVSRWLSDHPIIVATNYSISHSGFANNRASDALEGTKRGLLDVIVASRCKPIFYTQGSSFGRMIMYLSYDHSTWILNRK